VADSSVSQAVAEPVGPPVGRMHAFGLALARITTGLLWFSQLWWKLPPTFGCPADFAFSTRDRFTSGLCDWVGREAAYAGTLRVFSLDLHLLGRPNFYIDLSPISAAYGLFLRQLVIPNFGWMAWLIFLTEAAIAISLLLGLFGRLGALLGTGQALNLTIGLLPVPGEWEWAYIMLTTLNLMLFLTAANRYFGLDGVLHSRAVQAAARSTLARVVAWIT